MNKLKKLIFKINKQIKKKHNLENHKELNEKNQSRFIRIKGFAKCLRADTGVS